MLWYLSAFAEADIPPVLCIEDRSFSKPWGRDAFLAELSVEGGIRYLVRGLKGSIVDPVLGYVCIRVVLDEANLLRVAVAPEWRRKGVASWILQRAFAEAAARGAVTAYLEVRPSNHAAISLYENLGFTPVGKRPRYYPESGEDALIMRKPIKEEI